MALLRPSTLRFFSKRHLWIFTPNLPTKTVYCPRITPRFYSTPEKSPKETQPATYQQKLKKAVAEYGSTVIVFHVGISSISLGVCYLVVSSGLDVRVLMEKIGIKGETASKMATNAGTFAVAYAVHKVFAPVRIMITLGATPFIVRYLRSIGFLKKGIK